MIAAIDNFILYLVSCMVCVNEYQLIDRDVVMGVRGCYERSMNKAKRGPQGWECSHYPKVVGIVASWGIIVGAEAAFLVPFVRSSLYNHTSTPSKTTTTTRWRNTYLLLLISEVNQIY